MKKYRILLIGLAALPVFWIIESFIHTYIFGTGPLVDQLIRPEQNELWMRSVLMLTIIIITFLVFSFDRLRETEKLLAAAVKAAEDEKAEKEAIIAGIGDGIIVQDTDYKIIYQNEIQTEMYGNRNGEYCYKVYEGRDTICEGCPVELTYRDGKIHKDERCVEMDHETKYFELTSSPLKDASGKIIAGIKVVRDISVRKKYEEEILKYQTQLEGLVQERTYELEASNDLLKEEIYDRQQTQGKYHSLFANMINAFAYHEIILDDNSNPIDYRFLEINKSFEKLTGFKRKNVIGKKMTELIPEVRSAKPDLIKIYGNVALTGEDTSFELFFEPFQKWYSVSAYSPEKGYFASIFDDITEEKMLEKSLMEVEERERRRIGHDLHDGLGQLLTGLAFKVRGLGLTLEKSSLPEAEEAADISVLIDEAKEQVSLLSKGLSPVAMDEEGLMLSFKSISSYTEKMFGIPCIFRCEEPVVVNDETAITQLYRITQEAVTNAVKHAKPDTIEISLGRNDDKIIITIKDDGIGIPEKIDKKGSMGLKIMRYRASIINASLNIQRDINGGTLVTCILPYKSKEN
jgi:PAS domain S-box-containing protein